MSAAIIKTEASQKRRNFISKFLIYFFLIVITACMLLPFLWMLSKPCICLKKLAISRFNKFCSSSDIVWTH